jgi:hypothetical protein
MPMYILLMVAWSVNVSLEVFSAVLSHGKGIYRRHNSWATGNNNGGDGGGELWASYSNLQFRALARGSG